MDSIQCQVIVVSRLQLMTSLNLTSWQGLSFQLPTYITTQTKLDKSSAKGSSASSVHSDVKSHITDPEHISEKVETLSIDPSLLQAEQEAAAVFAGNPLSSLATPNVKAHARLQDQIAKNRFVPSRHKDKHVKAQSKLRFVDNKDAKPRQNPSRRSSFYFPYQDTNVMDPVSPFTKQEFNKGRNNDIDALSEESSDDVSDTGGNDMGEYATPDEFMDHVHTHMVEKNAPKPYKRHPLPSSVKWNGQTTTLESYIEAIEGHVDQQQHMSYLLIPKVAALWIRHGNATTVLRKATKLGLHHSLEYVTKAQFYIDIAWLYGALKQSLPVKGKQIVTKYKDSRDGLIVWSLFLDKYRYGGNKEVYLAEEQQKIRVRYTPDFPGGELGFLEQYETAFINIDSASDSLLFSDEGKRTLFLTNFSCIGHTTELVDILQSTTNTWDGLIKSLRRKMALRGSQAKHEGKCFAHTTVATNGSSINPYVAVFVNAVKTQDYNVGQALWASLNEEQRAQVLEWRKHARQLASGGVQLESKSMLPLPVTSSIVKNPKASKGDAQTNNKPAPLPMQYSNNNTVTDN